MSSLQAALLMAGLIRGENYLSAFVTEDGDLIAGPKVGLA